MDGILLQPDTHAGCAGLGDQPRSAPKGRHRVKSEQGKPSFSPSLETMFLHVVDALMSMSSKSASMKLVMWPSSLQHGRLTYLGIGSFPGSL